MWIKGRTPYRFTRPEDVEQVDHEIAYPDKPSDIVSALAVLLVLGVCAFCFLAPSL